MESLLNFQTQLLKHVSTKERYLLHEIDWSNRMIGIKGARGSGKTTLLLQRLKHHLSTNSESLYASLDHLYFLENSLLDLANEFVLNGGEYLFLDEVHKYPNWSRELKLIYDQYPQLKIVFTSSSLLEINKGESDLSRRAVIFHLKELSFREFLFLGYDIAIEKYSLQDILQNHLTIARQITEKVGSPIKYFTEYLKLGAYPYFLENKTSYAKKLENTLSLILEIDLNVVEGITYEDALKLKKLLVAISQSAAFIPNITKLSNRLNLQRANLINLLRALNRAELVIELFRSTKGIGSLTKPEKLYLNNTNLIHVLGGANIDVGSVRETFFANQFKHTNEIHLAEQGDFLIDRTFTFEVGGKNKTKKQIQDIENAYTVKDNIEVGGLNIIPLYLFGFMY